jgi:hypothetical protein
MCETCQNRGEVALRAEATRIVERPFDAAVDGDAWPCSTCRK